ncbi:MAG: hypothetical protein ABIN61_05255 [candidate division WOR-3 bacterium]
MSKITKDITLEEWEKLYTAAVDFRDIECWNWMFDTDLFGVQDPETKEIGYCSVLGNLGEFFSLNVYLGEEGLKSYLKMLTQEEASFDSEILYVQDCLVASFVNKEVLHKKDLEVIERLELKFQGENQWPIFRRYKPGFYPWFLTKEEVRFLTIMLEQAKNVALLFKKNETLFTPPQKGLLFVMTPEKKGKKIKWEEKWIRPEFKPEVIKIPIIDDYSIKEAKESINSKEGEWEIDFFYAPFTIQEKEEEVPYYPLVCLFIDHLSGLIIDFQLSKSREYLKEFLNKFLDIIEFKRITPLRILVKKKECYLLFKQIAKELEIELMVIESLKELEEAKKELFRRRLF